MNGMSVSAFERLGAVSTSKELVKEEGSNALADGAEIISILCKFVNHQNAVKSCDSFY